jgi:dihydrofolate reductase
VIVSGGPTIGGRFLPGGLLDEVRLHLVHFLLGTGTPLFDPRRGRFQQLEETRSGEDAGVTHFHPLAFRMTRATERSRTCQN